MQTDKPEDRIRNSFANWTPEVIIVDLVLALAAFWLPLGVDWLLYVVAGSTFFVALLVIMFHVSSSRAARSTEQLGFGSEAESLSYHLREKGFTRMAYVLGTAATIVTVIAGWSPANMASATLALSATCLAIGYAYMTRVWPADRRSVPATRTDARNDG